MNESQRAFVTTGIGIGILLVVMAGVPWAAIAYILQEPDFNNWPETWRVAHVLVMLAMFIIWGSFKALGSRGE